MPPREPPDNDSRERDRDDRERNRDSRERDRILLTEREWKAARCEMEDLREKVEELISFRVLTAATLAEVVEIARRNDRELLVFKTKAAVIAAGWGVLWTIVSAVITAGIIKFAHF